MIRTLRRWFAMLCDHECFRAVYLDGRLSTRQRYSQARALAGVFGGTVLYDPWN